MFKLLTCMLFLKVFVHDFVPRLTVDPVYQKLMHEEFHRVAARMGKYVVLMYLFSVYVFLKV